MIGCDEFLHLMAEDELDLTRESRSERDLHAVTCDSCYRLDRGYRAYVSAKKAERKRKDVGRDAPWVKESLVRAANAAIDRMEAAEKENAPSPRRRPVKALAVASSAVFLIASGLATEGGLALLSTQANHPETFVEIERRMGSGDKALSPSGVAPLDSRLKAGK